MYEKLALYDIEDALDQASVRWLSSSARAGHFSPDLAAGVIYNGAVLRTTIGQRVGGADGGTAARRLGLVNPMGICELEC